MRQEIGRLLVALSGARPEILAECLGESGKFQVLGWSILFEGLAAIGSSWLAVRVIERASVLVAVAVGVALGLAVIGFERWIVTSLPAGRPRLRKKMIPALAVAMVLAALISLPFLLQVVQPEINGQVAVIRHQRLTAFLAAEAKSTAGQLVTVWGKDVNNLEIIESLDGRPFDPGADPELQTLTRLRATELTLQQAYFEQWQCQLYGGQGCPAKGSGPIARASQESYLAATKQVDRLTSEIQKRYNQLSRARPSSGSSGRINVATQLSQAQLELSAATQVEIRQEDAFRVRNRADDGIVIRLEALRRVSASNPWLGIAVLLAVGLLVITLSIPALLRLSQPTEKYEVLLSAAIISAAGQADGVGSRTKRFWRRNSVPNEVFGEPDSESGEIVGHAFISYVRENKADVDRLQLALEAAGIPVWRDIRDLQPGQDWKRTIRRAISDDALAFVACFSRAGVGKPKSYQNDELLLAIEQFRQLPPGRLWLIPVRFDDCDIPDFDIGGGQTLASLQHADLFGDTRGDDTAKLIQTILQTLGRTSNTTTQTVFGDHAPADTRITGSGVSGSSEPEAVLEEVAPASFPEGPGPAAERDSYLNLPIGDAEANPSFVITAAWEQLSGIIANLMGAAQVQSRNQSAALRTLEARGMVAPDLANAIRELRKRRNSVAHGRHKPTREEAIEYARLAEALIARIGLEIRRVAQGRAEVANGDAGTGHHSEI